MNVYHGAEQLKSFDGPADWFTGAVHVAKLFQAEGPSRLCTAEVTFTAGARTAWHTHSLGQLLIVTSGSGRVQLEGQPVQAIRAGDMVWFAPGEKHWHGADADVAMTHIAIQEMHETDQGAWLEHVSDEQYSAPAV